MKLIYLTTSFPYSYEMESFFYPEMMELIKRSVKLVEVPRSMKGRLMNEYSDFKDKHAVCRPLISSDILADSLREIYLNPARVTDLASDLLKTSCVRNRVKNLAVLAKGLWLAGLARRLKADHIHSHWANATSTMALIAGELTGIPWSFTAHRGDIIENNLFAIKVEKASFVRFISKSGIDLTKKFCNIDPGHKAKVIHMCVDLPDLNNIKAPRGKAEATIMCAANMKPVKGHRHLIEAITLLKKRDFWCRLLLAGDGELKGELRAMVSRLGLDQKVIFLGELPHREVMRYYQDGKIGLKVLPSVDLGDGEHEGIPVSLMEAMSCRIPVLSTETGGVPELLGNGAGLIVEEKNPVALARGIERVITDHGLRETLAGRGRRKIEEEFSIQTVVGRMIDAFSETAAPACRI